MATSEILEQRGQLLARVREFFAERDFLEVETPLACAEVIPELHIEPQRVQDSFWLQASPELHMKRLLCAGAQAIYQITRSFRATECGRLHSPEFTIVEWYRVGDDMHAGMELLDRLCQFVAGAPPAVHVSYEDVWKEHMQIDPHRAACEQLSQRAIQLGVEPPAFDRNDRDEWLNLLLASQVEPHLGVDRPEIIYDYPATQSALARVEENADGVQVARRFELYWQGVELANGYDELTDAAALRQRLEHVNARRRADSRSELPLPESLLTAMDDPGLPASSGCALGFDRLAMLVCGAKSIGEVMTFTAE